MVSASIAVGRQIEGASAIPGGPLAPPDEAAARARGRAHATPSQDNS